MAWCADPKALLGALGAGQCGVARHVQSGLRVPQARAFHTVLSVFLFCMSEVVCC